MTREQCRDEGEPPPTDDCRFRADVACRVQDTRGDPEPGAAGEHARDRAGRESGNRQRGAHPDRDRGPGPVSTRSGRSNEREPEQKQPGDGDRHPDALAR